MVVRYIAALGTDRLRLSAQLTLVLIAGFIAGCSGDSRPPSYLQFMEDSIAREGTLARCNRDRQATLTVPECVNARRAAATIAARADDALREEREAASDILRVAARNRADDAQEARRRAEAAARAAAAAAYEAQWEALRASLEAEQLGYADPAAPEALPYVDLPDSARRREAESTSELEEISLPGWISYRR